MTAEGDGGADHPAEVTGEVEGEVGAVRTPSGPFATAVRWILLVVVVTFAGLALRSSWTEVRSDLARMTVQSVVLASLAFVLALGLQFFSWFRLLRGPVRGRPAADREQFGLHDGAVVYSVGQLGKYVPGAVWPAVIQADMGARRNLPWRRMVGAYTQVLVLSVTTGAVVGAVTAVGPVPWWVRVVALAGGVTGLVLTWAAVRPDALHSWMSSVMQRLTGAGFPERLVQRDAVVAGVSTLVAWVLVAVHAVLILRPLGVGWGDAVFVGGSFVFAWVCGIVAVPVPAGLGVREAVLVLTVGALTDRPTAIALALVSRLIQVAVDLGAAALLGSLGLALRRRRSAA